METLRRGSSAEGLRDALHDSAVPTGFEARRANVVVPADGHGVARLVAMTEVQPAQRRRGVLEPERLVFVSVRAMRARANIIRVDVDRRDDRERRAFAVFGVVADPGVLLA